MPEISIVMPVRDVATTVGPAVRSILAQTFDDWELLVLDDGSRDGTLGLVRDLAGGDGRIRCVGADVGRGIVARLNQGIALASGRYIARMDGDDVAYPRRLARQIARLHADPDVDLVACSAMVFAGRGRVRGARGTDGDHEELTRDVVRGIPLMHPTWLGRRTWFAEHLYSERARGCEDQELLLRAHASSRYAAMPDLLLGYRENRLKVRRSLQVRRHHSAFLLRHAVGSPLLAPAVVQAAAHGLKAVRDVVAAASGLGEVVLNARNRTPTAEELAEWARVWCEVSRT